MELIGRDYIFITQVAKVLNSCKPYDLYQGIYEIDKI
jgi:hypothetical protein